MNFSYIFQDLFISHNVLRVSVSIATLKKLSIKFLEMINEKFGKDKNTFFLIFYAFLRKPRNITLSI
jgi:hypothetical protein